MRLLIYSATLGTAALFVAGTPVFAQMHLDPSITHPTADGAPHICYPNKWYPQSALRRGIGGAASLCFHIEMDGTVSDVKVAETSGNDAIDRAAVNCVSTWRYKPAIKDGQPVRIPWAVIVAFYLDHHRPSQPIPDLTAVCENALNASTPAPTQ